MYKVAIMLKVWNEEFFLDLILPYYDWLGVDYVYIWDDGSTDNTVQMIRDFIASYTGKVIYHLFADKEPHKEYFRREVEGVLKNEHIKYIEDNTDVDWIINLDADEVLTAPWRVYVDTLKKGDWTKDIGYISIPTINLYDGIGKMLNRGYQDGTWYYYYPDRHIRIFNIRKNKMRFGTDEDYDQQVMPTKNEDERNHHGMGYGAALIHLHCLFPWRRSKRFAKGKKMQEKEFKTTDMVESVQVKDFSIYPDIFVQWYHKKVREVWGDSPWNFKEKIR